MNRNHRAVSVGMTVVISAAMGAVSSYLMLKNTPQAASASAARMYASNIMLSIVLGFLSAQILPFGKWGQGLADKANAKPPGVRFALLNALPLAVGNTVVISMILSFLGVSMARRGIPAEVLENMPPLPVMWLGIWVRLLLPSLCVSYLLSVLLPSLLYAVPGRLLHSGESGRRP